MITFNQHEGTYSSSIISVTHGFGTKQFGDGRNRKAIIKQSHSTNIQIISSSNNIPIENCDGIITKEKQIVLSVITADCVPIIFYDPVMDIIGISHQGWKGTLKKLPQKMIQTMQKLGSTPSAISVAIGPAINECCYEVSKERADQFMEIFGESVVSITNKYAVNLLKANNQLLKDSGVLEKNIDYFPFCTACNTEKFWSYRRDKGIKGEMLSYINR